jgi:hypothetical protein
MFKGKQDDEAGKGKWIANGKADGGEEVPVQESFGRLWAVSCALSSRGPVSRKAGPRTTLDNSAFVIYQLCSCDWQFHYALRGIAEGMKWTRREGGAPHGAGETSFSTTKLEN